MGYLHNASVCSIVIMLYDVILGVGESPLPIIYASSEPSTFVLGKHRDSRYLTQSVKQTGLSECLGKHGCIWRAPRWPVSHAKREANRIERVLRKARMYLASTAIAGVLRKARSKPDFGKQEIIFKHLE